MIIFLYKTDLLCTKHCFTVCLVFDSLVDNKNCKGQVTFLWTKFLKKSYENILNLRGELTLSLHSTLTELSPWETSRSSLGYGEPSPHHSSLQLGGVTQELTFLPKSHK